MPYIITTADTASSASRQHWIDTGEYLVSRRAVATLDEARELAPATDAPLDELGATYRMLDGTVIEVEQVREATLYNAIRPTLCCPTCGIQQSHVSGSHLIDAYNAAQETPIHS